jgi:hypothetical protein
MEVEEGVKGVASEERKESEETDSSRRCGKKRTN